VLYTIARTILILQAQICLRVNPMRISIGAYWISFHKVYNIAYCWNFPILLIARYRTTLSPLTLWNFRINCQLQHYNITTELFQPVSSNCLVGDLLYLRRNLFVSPIIRILFCFTTCFGYYLAIIRCHHPLFIKQQDAPNQP
jgi:hypothetical protein